MSQAELGSAPDLDGGGPGPRCGGRVHVRIQNR